VKWHRRIFAFSSEFNPPIHSFTHMQALFKLGKLHEAQAAGAAAPKTPHQHSPEFESLLETIGVALKDIELNKCEANKKEGRPLITVISETPAEYQL